MLVSNAIQTEIEFAPAYRLNVDFFLISIIDVTYFLLLIPIIYKLMRHMIERHRSQEVIKEKFDFGGEAGLKIYVKILLRSVYSIRPWIGDDSFNSLELWRLMLNRYYRPQTWHLPAPESTASESPKYKT